MGPFSGIETVIKIRTSKLDFFYFLSFEIKKIFINNLEMVNYFKFQKLKLKNKIRFVSPIQKTNLWIVVQKLGKTKIKTKTIA